MKRKFPYKWLLLALPYFLCLIGYMVKYRSPEYLVSALFESFKIYSMSVSDLNPGGMNIYLEIARWLGALVTTSIILTVLKHLFKEISLRWKLRNPEAIVVHGDGLHREIVLDALGDPAIAADGNLCFKAGKHVLAFEQDSAAIRYLNEHEKSFFKQEEKTIIFACSEFESSDYENAGLTASNTALNCARTYWQKHWLQDSQIRRIAIVGFGCYGQKLLEQSLLVNVLAWRPSIEYHIFGSDGAAFLNWRPQLKECLSLNEGSETMDSLHFHPSLSGMADLAGMDRIILTMDDVDENILCLNRLLTAGVTGAIHVRCSSSLLRQMQYLPERQKLQGHFELTSFGEDKELFSREVLFHSELTKTAKAIHLNYVNQSAPENLRRKYGSCRACTKTCALCAGCDNAARTWDDLTPFEKASNIATADHEPVKRWLLDQARQMGGIDMHRDALCQTEHIRWCRFYFLHNWQYAQKRDDGLRRHPALLPFDQLSKSEQEKDWWNYQNLVK